MSEIQEQDFEFTDEQREELKEAFATFDKDCSGFIECNELPGLLCECGMANIPQYVLRQYLEKYDKNLDHKMDFEEFLEFVKEQGESKFRGNVFKQYLSAKSGLKHSGGTSESSAEGTKHSHSKEEQVAFSDWINQSELLKNDPDLEKYLPIDTSEDSTELYERIQDGILLAKVINFCAPGTIDERVINKGGKLQVFKVHENHTLVINSAMAIGCNVINIGADDLRDGKKHLVLGLLWQVIRIRLFSQISLKNVPGLTRLLLEGETIDDLHSLSPEMLLLRWVNYQLTKYYENPKSNCSGREKREVKNFESDIKDSEAYSMLLYQITQDRHENTQVEHPDTYRGMSDLNKKAEKMLSNAQKIKCKKFVRAKDVVAGNKKLNLAFVANLFNKYPNLPEDEESKVLLEDEDQYREETREEKTFRNWINSCGVERHVNWLYKDLIDGIVLLKLYDVIRPGCVAWTKTNPEYKCKNVTMGGKMKCIENCNYDVELGQKEFGFNLVGIQGSNLHDGEETLTLGLVWQMMRAYVYSMLQNMTEEGSRSLTDRDMVDWVNTTLEKGRKESRIKSLKDELLNTSIPVLDLIDCIAPKMINPALITQGLNDEDKLENARYAISMGRKIGAVIYALPEDLVDVKPKMILTIFVCLRHLALKKNAEKKKGKPTKGGRK